MKYIAILSLGFLICFSVNTLAYSTPEWCENTTRGSHQTTIWGRVIEAVKGKKVAYEDDDEEEYFLEDTVMEKALGTEPTTEAATGRH